jgi:hypothetical protein
LTLVTALDPINEFTANRLATGLRAGPRWPRHAKQRMVGAFLFPLRVRYRAGLEFHGELERSNRKDVLPTEARRELK